MRLKQKLGRGGEGGRVGGLWPALQLSPPSQNGNRSLLGEEGEGVIFVLRWGGNS